MIRPGWIFLNTLAYKYWNSAPQETSRYANEALALADQIAYERGKAKAYYYLSISYWAQARFEEAIQNCLISLKISESLKDEDRVIRKKEFVGTYISAPRTVRRCTRKFNARI